MLDHGNKLVKIKEITQMKIEVNQLLESKKLKINPENQFAKMPLVIKAEIIKYLHPKDILMIISLVSKEFKNESSINAVWNFFVIRALQVSGEAKIIFKNYPESRISSYTRFDEKGRDFFYKDQLIKIEKYLTEIDEKLKELMDVKDVAVEVKLKNIRYMLSKPHIKHLIRLDIISIKYIEELNPIARSNLSNLNHYHLYIYPKIQLLIKKPNDFNLKNEIFNSVLEVTKKKIPREIYELVLGKEEKESACLIL